MNRYQIGTVWKASKLFPFFTFSGLAFYDWEQQQLIRRIEIQPKAVYWSETGELCCIVTEESYFILKYQPDVVASAAENPDKVSEDGIEDAFDVIGRVDDGTC